MKKLLLNAQNVILDSCTITKEVSNGLLVDDRVIYTPGTIENIIDVESIPDYVIPKSINSLMVHLF